MSGKRKSTLLRVINRVTDLTTRTVLSQERLAALEERLSRLDGGAGAGEAAKQARARVEARIGKAVIGKAK